MNPSNDEKAKGIEFTPDAAAKMLARLNARSRDDGDCRVWTGGRERNGYGVTGGGLTGRSCRLYVHRVAWALANGALPNGVVVRHACDNRPCIRPEHLLIGSTSDNNADTLERFEGPWRFGAWVTQRGTSHRSAKLNPDKVREIRRRWANGEAKRALGREFGVSMQSITLVVERGSWKHVE